MSTAVSDVPVGTPPASAPSPTPSDRSVRRRTVALRLALRTYWLELRRRPLMAIVAVLFPAVGSVLVSLVPPLILGELVARITGGQALTVAFAAPYVYGFMGSMLLGEACWRVGIHMLNRIEAWGIEKLYVDGMEALLAKDAAFYHENFAGSLTKRVIGYASRYEEFVDLISFRMAGEILPLGFAVVVLWQYDPLLVAVLLGMIALSAVLVIPLIKRRQKIVDAREESWARVSGHVSDTLSNMDAVRAHAAELREAAEHRRRVADNRVLMLRSWDYSNLRIDPIVAPMAVLTCGAGMALALLAVARPDGPGIAALVVTVTYFAQATRILFEFNQIYREVERTLTEAAQFAELLLDDPAIRDPAQPVALGTAPAEVRLEQVRFTHPGQTHPLFDGLDLRIGAGEKVGFVGRSGGGKTTVIRLLLRLMDVQGGRITLAGHEVRELTQSDLRGLIAYVPQDPAMFHRSLRDNIAFGRPDAGEDEIRAAAAAAHVLEFVEDLPDGFDTLVGERGVKLSGGQRQRVAIARAILRDAPILLLDEATSALDSASEAHIQRALWSLMDGRTAIAVAHRLSTVAGMDRLVVLDRGRIAEQGSHADLLAAGGGYADLWRRQSGGFLTE